MARNLRGRCLAARTTFGVLLTLAVLVPASVQPAFAEAEGLNEPSLVKAQPPPCDNYGEFVPSYQTAAVGTTATVTVEVYGCPNENATPLVAYLEVQGTHPAVVPVDAYGSTDFSYHGFVAGTDWFTVVVVYKNRILYFDGGSIDWVS